MTDENKEPNGEKREVSEARVASNRKSALKSTGPKTAEGKAVSKMNALKHGVYSEELILNRYFVDEDPEEFDQLAISLVNDLQPVGSMETILVEKIAISLWRLKRILRAEVGHFNNLLENLTGQYDYPIEPTTKHLDPSEVIDSDAIEWAGRRMELDKMAWQEVFEQPEFQEHLEKKHPGAKLDDLTEVQLKKLKTSFKKQIKGDGIEFARVYHYQRKVIPLQQSMIVPEQRMGQEETRLERSIQRDLATLKKLQEMRRAQE